MRRGGIGKRQLVLMGKGRAVDKTVKHAVTGIEIHREKFVTVFSQSVSEFRNMAFLKKDSRPIVDRLIARFETVLGRMDRKPSRLETLYGVGDKLQAELE